MVEPHHFLVWSVSAGDQLVTAHLESGDARCQNVFVINIVRGELGVLLGHQTTPEEVLEGRAVTHPDALLALGWSVSPGIISPTTHHEP